MLQDISSDQQYQPLSSEFSPYRKKRLKLYRETDDLNLNRVDILVCLSMRGGTHFHNIDDRQAKSLGHCIVKYK